MTTQQEPKDWRELLARIISDSHERERLAQELGVRSITLTRWASGQSDPRPQNLRHLINVLPEHRDQMLELIGDEFEDFSASPLDDAALEIPSQFYASVFSARGSTIESQRFWSISNLILQQALGQLDPDRLGMAITVVKCMKSSRSDKVRSLRETVGQGTPPWPGNLEMKGMFLGAESLAGYVVTTSRPAEIQNLKEDKSPLPAHQIKDEMSAAAHPILYTGCIAGCLLISSTQPNYFQSPSRLSLISNYANLVALAFKTEEFYDPAQIELLMMPSHTIQREYFADFRHRVTQAMVKNPIHNIQAEQYVWEQLEEELLRVQLDQDSVSFR